MQSPWGEDEGPDRLADWADFLASAVFHGPCRTGKERC